MTRKGNKKNKVVSIKAKNVNVSGPARSRSRNRQSNRRNRATTRPLIHNEVTEELASLNVGKMAEVVPVTNQRRDRRMQALLESGIELKQNEESWFHKYMDPAGATEMGCAPGEFSKIPDGLCTFSVGAEIRTVSTLQVPSMTELVDPEGNSPSVPLDGKNWSLTVISYPCYRTGYIAAANYFNAEFNDTVSGDLCYALNNIQDYPAFIEDQKWTSFSPENPGWYFFIAILPPTYDMPDPTNALTRTVTSYRLTYKSITFEHNTPTLVDQGFWVGGHLALDYGAVSESPDNKSLEQTWVGIRNVVLGSTVQPNTAVTVTIRNLSPQVMTSANASLGTTSMSTAFFSVRLFSPNNASPGWFDYLVPEHEVWRDEAGDVLAVGDDLIRFELSVPVHGEERMIAVRYPNTVRSLTLPYQANAVVDYRVYITLGYEEGEGFKGGMSKVIELPAMTPSQLAANDVKMEQFLMKDSEGAYLVHRKMRQPVFGLTSATTHGPIQFSCPGYNPARNYNDGSGIIDTIDNNLSTGVVHFRGISHANNVVCKLYQGWEGVTNTHTTLGQFGHAGLAKNEALLTLADALVTETTGIYPASYNFLGKIAKFASGMLGKLFNHQATEPMVKNLANSAVKQGFEWLRSKLG